METQRGILKIHGALEKKTSSGGLCEPSNVSLKQLKKGWSHGNMLLKKWSYETGEKGGRVPGGREVKLETTAEQVVIEWHPFVGIECKSTDLSSTHRLQA